MTDLNSIAEQNARMRARADYFRWLNKYYGSAELAEMSDEPEPVNLRQIFVPMRVGVKDLAETDMAQPNEIAHKETPDNLPGVDAFDLIGKQPFVCLSGLPGSGKTTLTKALIGELCGNFPSRLRSRLEGQRGIAPIPIILREIPGIDRIKSLGELMEAWWQNLERKTLQGDSLDIARLRYSFSSDGDNFPRLLLFDGIDETGGPDVRQTIVDIAINAHQQGNCRVLVTGRPNGFADLKLPRVVINADDSGLLVHHSFRDDDLVHAVASCLHHLLPLAWPQIQNFIDRWYRLRPEWEIKRQDGADHFLAALQDSNRPYLLALARRPIFLTLMALVHCTRNEMPHGRADLYEAIVDLYLNRQERHRQLKYGTKGNELKVWPAQEKRRVLGRIAFESQTRGSDLQDDGDDTDRRRILWPHSELLEFIETYLRERAGSGGIAPEEAGELLDYYLHPAGLLISPKDGDICFAHLSFQEYLCAEDIQRRLSGRKFVQVFQEDLVERLNRPGWDEVGLLLLAIHKNRSEDGHLELLSLLRPQQNVEASLLVRGLAGKELALTPSQRQAWLSVLVACCLLHPDDRLASHLVDCPELEKPGLALLIELLKPIASGDGTTAAESQWKLLRQQGEDNFFPWTEQYGSMLACWLNADWSEEETDNARFHSFLMVLVGSHWGYQKNDELYPVSSSELELVLIDALRNNIQLWCREQYEKFQGLAVLTKAGLLLQVLLPNRGPLWRKVLEQMPVDAWLLQGEVFNSFPTNLCTYPMVLLSLYPEEELPARTRLALGLYQVICLIELFPLKILWDLRRQVQSQLQSQSEVDFWEWMWSWSRSLSLWQKLAGQSGHSPISLWLKNSPSLRRALSRSTAFSRPQSLPVSLSLTLWQSVSINDNLRHILEECLKRLSSMDAEQVSEDFIPALESFGYRYATNDWFSEQAEQPELMRRRGLHPAEPLPRALGLFDPRGMPLERQRRDCWLKLQAWLQSDDEVLAFFFPEGLSADEEAVLRSDLEILKTQPWSPHAFVADALDNWPEHQAQRDFSFAAAQEEMVAACRAFLAATENE